MHSYAHSNCFSWYIFQLEAIFLSTGDPSNISDVQMCCLNDISPLTYTRVLIFLTSSRNILSDKLNILFQSRLRLMIHSHIDKEMSVICCRWALASFYGNFLSLEMCDSVLYINAILFHFLYSKSNFSIHLDFWILCVYNTLSKPFLLASLSLGHY